MNWRDEIKKSDRNFISTQLNEEARMFLKELYEYLDGVVDSIKEEFDNYPEYDRDRIEKVILKTLKDDIRGIKINLKYSQKLLIENPRKKR